MQVNTNITKARLYSIQTYKNRVGFVSCSLVVSNFTSPICLVSVFENYFMFLKTMITRKTETKTMFFEFSKTVPRIIIHDGKSINLFSLLFKMFLQPYYTKQTYDMYI